MKFSGKYFVAFSIILTVEILIALFVHDRFIRPYLGDVIVICLIYCFFKSFLSKKITLLPLYIFLFAVMVEILQYFNIVELLHIEGNTFARIIIGNSFSFLDIVCYFAGMALLFGWQKLEKSKAAIYNQTT